MIPMLRWYLAPCWIVVAFVLYRAIQAWRERRRLRRYNARMLAAYMAGHSVSKRPENLNSVAWVHSRPECVFHSCPNPNVCRRAAECMSPGGHPNP